MLSVSWHMAALNREGIVIGQKIGENRAIEPDSGKLQIRFFTEIL